VTELALIAIKMLVTAAVVVGASVAAERLGPIVGGLIITLPISAGPGYFFLALAAENAFLAETTLYSLAMTAATVGFLIVYPRLAVRFGATASVGLTLLVWLLVALVVRELPLSLPLALALNVLSFALALFLPRPPGLVATRRTVRADRRELLGRAFIAGAIVATVVTLSSAIGPEATGILIVFPTAFTAIAWILHRRWGGPAAAATLLASAPGMLSFLTFLVVLYLVAEPVGGVAALGVALAAAVVASGLIALVTMGPRTRTIGGRT